MRPVVSALRAPAKDSHFPGIVCNIEMHDTKTFGCRSLSAPQVGVNRRLMVFNPEGDPRRRSSEVVLCNPEVIEYSQDTSVEEEGCLSFPGFTADVERSERIRVQYQDIKGRTRQKTMTGWEARIFQHEFDHTNAVLYIDRLVDSERLRVQTNLDELIEAHGPGGAL